MSDDVYALRVENLTKTYASQGKAAAKTALYDVSLKIPKGSITALLGTNGAGKSTLINIMAGLVVKTSGKMFVDGIDIDENHLKAKKSIGIVPQELNIDPFFTPREAMELQAGLYGVPKAQRRTMEILTMLGLADKADAYARTLSGGMRRRLMVAKAMVHDPEILVLDEPTAGVDVDLRQQLWRQVSLLNQRGKTIILTTHYLEEAESLCDYINIINHGKLIVSDTKSNLLGQLDQKKLMVKVAEPISDLDSSLLIYNPQIAHNIITFDFKPSETPVMQLVKQVEQAGYSIIDMSIDDADLEDLFLQLVA